ncbi:hypothetical protein ANANG_G00038510, partial [Anguilla anguilla]
SLTLALTSGCDHKNGIFIHGFKPLQGHLVTQLLNDIKSNLNTHIRSTLQYPNMKGDAQFLPGEGTAAAWSFGQPKGSRTTLLVSHRTLNSTALRTQLISRVH